MKAASLLTPLWFVFFIALCSSAWTQNNIPLLDRKVSVNFSETPLPEALFMLAEKANFNLSCNADVLPAKTKISFACTQKTLSVILAQILPADIEIKTSGNTVVLVRKAVKAAKKKTIIIQGRIVDSSSGKPIQHATVLEVYSSQSTLSDTAGYFELHLSQKEQNLILATRKRGYAEHSLLLVADHQELLIRLQPFQQINEITQIRVETISSRTIESYRLGELMIPQLLITHAENIPGYTKRFIQLSLLPGLSSNLKIAGTIKNKISVNLIGGYNYGVDRFELAGAFNINREDVKGVQLAGFSNLVGGEVHGLQMAGAINRTKGKQSGLQVAGGGNLNSDSFSGHQLAGGVNAASNLNGVQISGGVNHADTVAGAQISSAYNRCKRLRGFQISAGVNVCTDLQGMQIGIFNKAKTQRGFQFGLINFNDTSSGVSIGVINIIKDRKIPRVGVAFGRRRNIIDPE